MIDVLWAGTYVQNFERNKRLAEYLEISPVRLRTVNLSLWPEDRVGAFASSKLQMLPQILFASMVLLVRLLRAPTPDVYLVSYPGWFDVPIVWFVAKMKRRPVVFDVFISLFDTAVSDRSLASASSVAARLARLVDRVSLRLSSRVVADCPVHGEFMASLAGIPNSRIGVLYLGADERVFEKIDEVAPQGPVLFYGNFVPLQGVETILQAASLLPDVPFRLVGDGQTWESMVKKAGELELGNVAFTGRLSQQEIVSEMGRASICLGVFGETDKAQRVIPHKVFEALACARPIITGATQAVVAEFDEGELEVVRVGDPEALADRIRSLWGASDRLESLGRQARARFEANYSAAVQADRLLGELEQSVGT